jgi:asparagine synthase (glutamine-hydrolysing)
MAMAHSLEGRSPFLDHEVAAWAARLPIRMKVRGMQGKVVLRKAFSEYLPAGIQRRGKQGFGIPVGTWFRGPLKEWIREVLMDTGSYLNTWFSYQARQRLLDQHINGKVDHGKRLYALAVLGLWLRTE